MSETTSALPALPNGVGSEGADSSPPAKRERARVAFSVLLALALAIGATSYWLGHGRETTDDAQVEGRVASVNARTTGYVVAVHASDNQAVLVGDVLAALDDREQAIRVAAARAELAGAEARLRAARAALEMVRTTVDSNLAIARGGLALANAARGATFEGIKHAQAEVEAAASRRRLAEREAERARQLLARGALSRAELDAREAAFEQAHASFAQSQTALASARASLASASGSLTSARGRLRAAEAGPAQIESALAEVELCRAGVEEARAALDQAELALSHCQVRAQVSGVVARRSVEVGQLATPERPLMAIVPLDDTWVVANFKEDQIAKMRPGQSVSVHVDTYDTDVAGHVDSLAGGTGSRFSLLPPDNASGNFTKVVQRVPVLIRLGPHPETTLRPGMSVTATVFIGEH